MPGVIPASTTDDLEIAAFEAAQGVLERAVDVADRDVHAVARLLLIAAAQLVWDHPLHGHAGPVADMLEQAVAETIEAYFEPLAEVPQS